MIEHGIALREFSVGEHLRSTVGSDIMASGQSQGDKQKRLRLALEDIYTEVELKAANCRNDHKRMALSVATAYAMQEGAISW